MTETDTSRDTRTPDRQKVDREATAASRIMAIWIADHGNDYANEIWYQYNDAIKAWGNANKRDIRALLARAENAEAERDTAWNDAIEAAAECVGHITQSEDRDAILALKKGDPP